MGKKDEQLGTNFCTASNKLKKQILFDLVRKLNLDNCFRCNKLIENINDFSVDHKVAWLDSKNPVSLFYDLNNIAFSHLKCNIDARDIKFKPNKKTGFKGVYLSGRSDKKYQSMIDVKSEDGKIKTINFGRFFYG